MAECVRIFVRYDTKDDKGETRRERNEKFDTASPLLIIPDGFEYIWNWYWDISESLVRVKDSVCFPLTPSEILAWSEISGNIINTPEFEILRTMDKAYCSETRVELKAYNERLEDERKRELEQRQRQRRRR